MGVACGAKRFEYFTLNISFSVFLMSRDVENRLFCIKEFRMRYLMFSEVGNMSFYVFVGAPRGPDPRRAPPGPRGRPRAQGPGEGPPGPRARCAYICVYNMRL